MTGKLGQTCMGEIPLLCSETNFHVEQITKSRIQKLSPFFVFSEQCFFYFVCSENIVCFLWWKI